jgi:hypothetical protein
MDSETIEQSVLLRGRGNGGYHRVGAAPAKLALALLKIIPPDLLTVIIGKYPVVIL